MPAVSESHVAIRFFGDELDPSEITRLLGHPPTKQYRKGDSRRVGGREVTRKVGAWVFASEPRLPEAIDDQLAQMFASMNPDVEVWRMLTSRFKANVFCGLFMSHGNEGLSLSVDTLHGLAARGLELWLDIYDPTDE